MARKKQAIRPRSSTGRGTAGPPPLLMGDRSALVRGKLVALLGHPPSSDPAADITLSGPMTKPIEPEAQTADRSSPPWQILLASKLSTIH